MKTGWMTLGLCGVLAVSGCGQKETQDLSGEVETLVSQRTAALAGQAKVLETRVSELEAANARLATEVNILKEKTPDDIRHEVQTALASDVDQAISARLKDQGGTVVAVPAAGATATGGASPQVFAQMFRQQMALYEEEKQKEEQAQREQRRQEWEQRRAQERAQRLAQTAKDLGLNEDQTKRLEIAQNTLRDSIRDKFREMRESGNFNRDQMRESIDELRGLHEQIVSQFMTPEQLKAYQESQDNVFSFGGRGSRGGRGGPGGPGGPGGGR